MAASGGVLLIPHAMAAASGGGRLPALSGGTPYSSSSSNNSSSNNSSSSGCSSASPSAFALGSGASSTITSTLSSPSSGASVGGIASRTASPGPHSLSLPVAPLASGMMPLSASSSPTHHSAPPASTLSPVSPPVGVTLAAPALGAPAVLGLLRSPSRAGLRGTVGVGGVGGVGGGMSPTPAVAVVSPSHANSGAAALQHQQHSLGSPPVRLFPAGASTATTPDSIRSPSPVRFQPPLTLPAHLAQMQIPSAIAASSSSSSSSSSQHGGAVGSTHLLPVGTPAIGTGVQGRGLKQDRQQQAHGRSSSGNHSPKVHRGGGAAPQLQSQQSLSKSASSSGNVTYKSSSGAGGRPPLTLAPSLSHAALLSAAAASPAPLTLPGVFGRVSREQEEESASQRARDAQQQQNASLLSPQHLPPQHQQQQQQHSPQPQQVHGQILSPLLVAARSPTNISSAQMASEGVFAIGMDQAQKQAQMQAAYLQQQQALQLQQQQQMQSNASIPPLSSSSSSSAGSSSGGTDGSDVLLPSASVLPASSSHKRIVSLPLYVSAKKPRAYRTHITYCALGGVVKENSIGGGKSAAEALASLTRPLAAAADASLIDETAGRLFLPQKHTQSYKSHFQKKSHQAVFALFAATDRVSFDENIAAAENGPPPPSSPSSVAAAPSSSASDSSSSAAVDVGTFYAQFFRQHFIELMEAHFPLSSSNTSASGLGITDRSGVSSMSGVGGLSVEETKASLYAVVNSCIRSMEAEAFRLYNPEKDVVGSGCAFCVLLIAGGVLYTYNSSFVTQPLPVASPAAGAVAAAASPSPSSSPVVDSLSPQSNLSPLRIRAHQRVPSTGNKNLAPQPFQALLCRGGRPIDLSAPHHHPGAGPLATEGINSLLAQPTLGSDCITERVLTAQDEFVLLSSVPLAKNATGADSSASGTNSSAAAAAAASCAPFPDPSSLCQFILASPTPQDTVTRIVEVQERAAGAQAGGSTLTTSAGLQPLLMSLIYF